MIFQNRPFPHYAPVSKHKEMKTRLGWTISYKSLYFVHPSLELVPLFTGMRERSIVSHFTRRSAREITYNNFGISLVVFLPNMIITTNHAIECFHSRGQHVCKFIVTKKNVCIRKEFNSQRTGLGNQHGRRFIVLGQQYGRRDFM